MADNKLYPPTIASSIPAFYEEENGTVKITVPFSMNRAVSQSDIGGFSLKVKTAQSNSYIYSFNNGICDYNKKIVTFFVNNNKYDENNQIIGHLFFKLGQFYKFQLAYIDNDLETIGYYSTVAVGKFTSKPLLDIKEYKDTPVGHIPFFYRACTGIYQVTDDVTERPYAFRFLLYNSNMEIIEDTDWLLHNSTLNTVAQETLNPEETIDTYTFKTAPKENLTYYVVYGVRTINNLELYSQPYPCMDIGVDTNDLNLSLVAENIFDEGYIKLRLQPKENTNMSSALHVSIEIERAEKTDGYQSWKTLKKVYFNSYNTAVNEWSFNDFTIEQGITYQYAFRQYNENGIYTARERSNTVYADFEDMFLLGENNVQLKVRFNPKITSFKETKLEQKIDTIGNKYPFIFRNGSVSYKQFPINGLISYQMDLNQQFLNYNDDLNLFSADDGKRRGTNSYDNDIPVDFSYEQTETSNLLGYNMAAERRFKMKVLDWLNDGKIKLFRSPAEGNYLIRILNVSLSPEDKLGRMIHSFTATAYEMMELTYDNLITLGFITLEEAELTEVMQRTVAGNDLREEIGEGIEEVTTIKLNQEPMFNSALVSISRNTELPSHIVLRIDNDANRKIYLSSSQYFNAANKDLADLYLNRADNDVNKFNDILNSLLLTYQYKETRVRTGDISNINNVYATTSIQTKDDRGTYELLHNAPVGLTVQTEDIKLLFLQIAKKRAAIEDNETAAYKYQLHYVDNTSSAELLLDHDISIDNLDNISSITIGEGVYITYGVLQKVIEIKE